jgi:hypothetical protein
MACTSFSLFAPYVSNRKSVCACVGVGSSLNSRAGVIIIVKNKVFFFLAAAFPVQAGR